MISLNIELLQHQWVFLPITFAFASLIGSFLNVVIHRLPVMLKRGWQQECNDYLNHCHPDLFSKKQIATLNQPIDSYPEKYNLMYPGSACPKCGSAIKPWQNIPIFGWLMLGGKCAVCKTAIAIRYPLVECFTALLTVLLAWHFGPTLEFALASILTFCLIALSFIDLDEMLLPDQITLPLLWLGLLININGTFTDINSAIIGAAAGYLSLWSIFWGFKLLTGKEGMGYGDFKLLAVFGAWLGWQLLPLIILLSSLVGAIVGVSLIIFKRHQATNPIPFGPYIAIAGWLGLLWGEQINHWYLNLLM